VKTRTRASSTDKGVSVAVPLGKGSDALKKHWKFVANFSTNIVRVNLEPSGEKTILQLSSSDSDGVAVCFNSKEEAKKWLVLILPA
jgi:hypothetical protein